MALTPENHWIMRKYRYWVIVFTYCTSLGKQIWNFYNDENIIFYIYIYVEHHIKDLMKYLRSTWPEESITPKLHLLEEHALEFIKVWHVGFGFYGEQGAESIHAEFNRLNVTYCRIKPPSRRLQLIVKEHNLSIHPEAKKLQPAIKRRNLRKTKLQF